MTNRLQTKHPSGIDCGQPKDDGMPCRQLAWLMRMEDGVEKWYCRQHFIRREKAAEIDAAVAFITDTSFGGE